MVIGDYMKKLSLIILFMFVILFSSCSLNTTNTDNDNTDDINYSTKVAIYTNDSWVYYCYVDFDKNSTLENSNYKNYDFDAYNLKYKELDGYDKVPVIDSHTNEVVEYVDSSVPRASLNSELSEEFEMINDWLNTVQPVETIDADDLSDLEVQHIDIDLFINLFNEMINSENMSTGQFGYLPEANIVQGELTDGYEWQIGYFVSHGCIKYINIELIYDAEVKVYLSDIVLSNKATLAQQQTYEIIEKVEQEILDKQILSCEMFNFDDENIDFDRLETLLKSLEEG
ncbi:MAG: hypothetical protein LUH82_07935 [Clostridiales bacterium]|nr:hypothetical protein [Clostridiales bacterium]